MDTELLLGIQGMSVEFPGIKALDSVDFTLRKGEIVALLGENGAGKSTLIKALTGVYRRSAGEIFLEGNAIDPLNTAHAQFLGIGTVYQEVNLLPNLSVAANLFLGREPLRFGMIDQKAMARLAREIVAYYGLRIEVTDPLGNYSIAIQQIIAIARAVDLSAKVLILDEPTASLDANEVDMLFGILSHLREHGVGMIFVTHFLDQVYRLSDRITVLRNGKLVGSEMTAALPRIDLVQMMLGHSFDEPLLKRSVHATETGEPLVEFRGYGRRNMVDPFDLSVAPGEIVGLAGLLDCWVRVAQKPHNLSLALKRRTAAKPRLMVSQSPFAARARQARWVLAIALKTVKLRVSSARRPFVRTLFWRCRPSADGYVRWR